MRETGLFFHLIFRNEFHGFIIFKYRTMGKKVTKKPAGVEGSDSDSEYAEGTSSAEIFEDESEEVQKKRLPSGTRRPSPLSPSSRQQTNKQRKARAYNPEDRFLPTHIKRYYLFPFYYSTLFPYFKISWKVWKPNSVYKKMAQFLSNLPGLPSKTSVQCKSFDQRMKDLNHVSPPASQKVDLFQAAITYLRGEVLEPEDRDIIRRYVERMKERSTYMSFLRESVWSEASEEEAEGKRSSEVFAGDCKKEETSIETLGVDRQPIFNEFLDAEK